MSVELAINSALNQTTPQAVMDQDGNVTSFFLGQAPGKTAGPSGYVGVQSNGSPGGTATFWVSSYIPGDGNSATIGNTNITVTDQGNYQAVWALNLMTPTPPTLATYLSISSAGQYAVPRLANLPSSGSLDLVVQPGGVIAAQTSSARFKEDVRSFRDDFHKVLALDPKSFRYTGSGDETVGYLAEDLHEVGLKSLVRYDADGKPLAIDYKMISLYLVEMVKEQQVAIRELREEVAGLKRPQ